MGRRAGGSVAAAIGDLGDHLTAPSSSRPRPLLTATALEWARLERSARRGWSAVEAGQLRALIATVDVARRAPFWSEHLRAFPPPRSTADLAELPTVDKDALRAAAEHDLMTAPKPPGTRVQRTSGSTGEPIRVLYGPRGAWFQGVLSLRMFRGRGLQAWSRGAAISVLPLSRQSSGLLGAVRARRRAVLQLGERDAMVEGIQRTRPAWVAGHSQVLIQLGEALAGSFRPRAVLTNGDTVTADRRAALGHLFGVEPLDMYGTSECGVVAWQCAAADLYHVNHEAVVVEILGDDMRPAAPGATGHVVLTSLWNPLMPFVRYCIGDAAAWADRPCACGSPLPALTHISGRTYDWVIDAAGNRVAPHSLLLSVHAGVDMLDAVRQYRIRQSSDRRVLVELIPVGAFTPEDATRLTDSYRRLLGGLPVEVRTVAQLETAPGGKLEVIRSDAAPGTDGSDGNRR